MKKTMIAIAILLATTATFAQVAKDSTHKTVKHTTSTKKYTCTMHPEVVSNKPGKCPKCGMDLVLMKSKTTKTKKTMSETKM